MSEMSAALLADYDAAAIAAQSAEDALRNRLAQEVGQLERQRAFAFRRANLVRLLISSAARCDTEEAALGSQRAALRNDLEWRFESDPQRAILDRLQTIGRAIWQCTRNTTEDGPACVHAELQAFEAWYETTHGKSFYALFDQYFPELPVVEF